MAVYAANGISRAGLMESSWAAVKLGLTGYIIPFMFVYGEQTGRHFLKDRALEWLDQLPAEDNSIITKWKELGAVPESAFESQALLQLKNSYCDKKRCLHCHVGSRLIRSH